MSTTTTTPRKLRALPPLMTLSDAAAVPTCGAAAPTDAALNPVIATAQTTLPRNAFIYLTPLRSSWNANAHVDRARNLPSNLRTRSDGDEAAEFCSRAVAVVVRSSYTAVMVAWQVLASRLPRGEPHRGRRPGGSFASGPRRTRAESRRRRRPRRAPGSRGRGRAA